ncbi:MAG: response regulator [Verrucomicrobia bacterium]|nr:response regulator [Verrucomicrobiota bacterium]
MPIEKILVLEDDSIFRKNLELQLRERRYDVVSAETLAEAEEKLARDSFDLMMVDIRLPDGDGSSLLATMQGRPSQPLLVMMSNFGNIQSAVECMRNGAIDYLAKPYTPAQLDFTLKKAEQYNQLVKVNRFFNHDEGQDGGGELLGRSAAMEQLRQLIRKVAPTQATVLIQGESGTGKELVARALYRQSPRAGAAFIKMNCAAVPENLIESEFLGHEKGSFTGALSKREGRFELAHGGTILLDEVSEVSPSIQAKLLRVLQERELERVGGNRTLAAKMLDISIRTLRNKLNDYAGRNGSPQEIEVEESAEA